jgi:hypothetical protein
MNIHNVTYVFLSKLSTDNIRVHKKNTNSLSTVFATFTTVDWFDLDFLVPLSRACLQYSQNLLSSDLVV